MKKATYLLVLLPSTFLIPISVISRVKTPKRKLYNMVGKQDEILDLHNPHDSLFKQAFKHKETLIDFLQNRLEPELLSKLDPETLKLENSSFIESKLKKSYSDLVFSVKASKKRAYIYILVEHQSKEDKHMMLRLLEYNAKLMRQHVTQTKTQKLPAIINLVLYSGAKPYKGAKTLLEAFENPKLYSSLLKRNLVIELASMSDEELLKDKKAALAEFVLTYSRYRDFCHMLDQKSILIELIESSSYAEAAVIYMLAYAKHKEEEILDKVSKLDPKKKDQIINALQRIEQRGIQLIARQMLAENEHIKDIARWTGLTPEQILALKG